MLGFTQEVITRARDCLFSTDAADTEQTAAARAVNIVLARITWRRVGGQSKSHAFLRLILYVRAYVLHIEMVDWSIARTTLYWASLDVSIRTGRSLDVGLFGLQYFILGNFWASRL